MTDSMSDEEQRLDILDTKLRGSIADADVYLRRLQDELHGWGPYPGSDVIARRLGAHYFKVRVAIDLARDLVSRDPGVVQ